MTACPAWPPGGPHENGDVMTAFLNPADPAPATVLVLSGPARDSRIEVPAGGLVFGRAAGSAGRLGDDPALSRWHARLDPDGEGLVVEDLASTNGTLLNGQRISGRQPVRPGDVVTLGGSQLQLQTLPAPAAAPPQLRTLATGLLPAVAAARPAPPAPAAPRPAAAAPPAAPHPAAPPVPAAHPAAGPPVLPAAPAAAHPPPGALTPGQQPAWPAGLAQPGSPPAPGSWGLAELSGVRPSFVAVAGRYLGKVVRGYLVLAVLFGVLAAVLQIVRYRFGVTLPTPVMPGQWAKPAAAALALSGGGLAVVAYLRTASTRLSLHPGRLEIERGLLRRETTAIDLREVRRVTLGQTALQRLTGDGTLLLELTGGAGPIPVTGLARGPQLQQIFRQLAALTPASRR